MLILIAGEFISVDVSFSGNSSHTFSIVQRIENRWTRAIHIYLPTLNFSLLSNFRIRGAGIFSLLSEEVDGVGGSITAPSAILCKTGEHPSPLGVSIVAGRSYCSYLISQVSFQEERGRLQEEIPEHQIGE